MRHKKRILGCLFAVLPFAAWLAVAQPDDDPLEEDNLLYILFGIIEGPDPIPPYQWDPADSVDEADSDDSESDDRDDGRPDFAVDPISGRPMVVWAYDTGSDHDIAFNQWSGTGWLRDDDFLTSSPEDELDPRIYAHTDGTVYVTWWEDREYGRVLLRERRSNASVWQGPTQVMNHGRRPSVAVWNGIQLVAYERDGSMGRQEIVLAARRSNGMYATETVFSVGRMNRLDVELHVAGTRLWMDWKQSESMFAYSELIEGSWTSPILVPWSDPSWLGEEVLRQEIEQEVLAR